MSERTRVVIIGAGYWAVTNHLPVLARRSDVEIAAIAGHGAELVAVAERYGIPVATQDGDEALSVSCDAVVVATPNDLHFPYAERALRLGRHLLVEKPLAVDPSHAWTLAALADDAGVVAMIPHGWNYKDFLQDAARLVRAGVLGEVESFSCNMASPTIDLFDGLGGYGVTTVAGQELEAAPQTWADSSRGGGYAYGQLTHALGLLFWLVEMDAVEVVGRTRRSRAGVDVVNAAIVTLSNGAVGTLMGQGHLPDGSRFQVDLRITGTRGVLLLDMERERCELRLRDGTVVAAEAPSGSGDYDCADPVDRWIDLVRGSTADNNSPLLVGARSVAAVAALLSSAATGTPSAVSRGVQS